MNVDLFGLSKVADSVMGGLDDLITSDEERAQAKTRVLEILAKQDNAQSYINAIDATSNHWVQYAWRPGIAWTGTIAIFYQYIVYPLTTYLYALFNDGGYPLLPNIPTDEIMPLIMGLLGLGAFRSFDKLQGKRPR
jgi:hypothetical protein